MFKKYMNEKNDLLNEIHDLQEENNNLFKQRSVLIDEIKQLNEQKEKLNSQIKMREKFYVETELKYIDFMPGFSFEKYSAELLEELGYSSVATKSSNDFGGDVIAEKDGTKYAIQCKRYNEKISAKPIGEALRARGNYKCDKAVVFTNNYFTENAIQEAQNCDVELWDRDDLTQFLYEKFAFEVNHIDIHRKNVVQKEEIKEEDIDPLLEEAIECVIETQQASTSFIQRRFKIGYARSGRIIDQMEERGIISGYQGSNPREVLMSKERWNELKNMK